MSKRPRDEQHDERAGQQARTGSDLADQLPDIEEGDDLELLDLAGLKRKLLGLEKRINANQEQRVRFIDQPEKFMQSEIALDQHVHEMHAISMVPQLYGELVRGQLATLVACFLFARCGAARPCAFRRSHKGGGGAAQRNEPAAWR